MNFQKIVGCFVLGAILFSACGVEPAKQEDNYVDKVLGHWEVFEATRNEKPTTTLEDAYFDFENDGKAILNLTGVEQPAHFEITEKIINIVGTTQMDGDYIIENLTSDTLILSTAQKFNDIPFRFIFRMIKTEKEEI